MIDISGPHRWQTRQTVGAGGRMHMTPYLAIPQKWKPHQVHILQTSGPHVDTPSVWPIPPLVQMADPYSHIVCVLAVHVCMRLTGSDALHMVNAWPRGVDE